MKFLEALETKIILERLVIGLEEPILIKGLGEIRAKIDSGNGGYNVLHGINGIRQGDTLIFDTVDQNNNPKKISAKIISEIDVNMGAGNIERRPVIELNIKFAGETYKKIPFSISDRSTNQCKVLISKNFVQNELNALIDVSAKNISSDAIHVDYNESYDRTLNEGVWDKVKSVAGATKKVAGAVIGAPNTALKTVNKTLNPILQYTSGEKGILKTYNDFLKLLGGNTISTISDPKNKELADSLLATTDLYKYDVEQIRLYLTQYSIPENVLETDQCVIGLNTIVPWHLRELKAKDYQNFQINYICGIQYKKGEEPSNIKKGEVIKGTEYQHDLIKKKCKELKKSSEDINRNKSALKKESYEYTLFNEDAPQNTPDSPTTTTNQETNTSTEPGANTEETQKTKLLNKRGGADGTDINRKNLNDFILYFVSYGRHITNKEKFELEGKKFKKTIKNRQPNEYIELVYANEDKRTAEVQDTSLLGKNIRSFIEQTIPTKDTYNSVKDFIKKNTDIDTHLAKIYSLKKVEPKNIESIIVNCKNIFEAAGYQGFFCLCYTPYKQSRKVTSEDLISRREIKFFENANCIAFPKIGSNTDNFDKLTNEELCEKIKGFNTFEDLLLLLEEISEETEDGKLSTPNLLKGIKDTEIFKNLLKLFNGQNDGITPIKNPDLLKAIQSSELFKTLLSLLQNEGAQIKNGDLIKNIKDSQIFKKLIKLLEVLDFESKLSKVNRDELINNIKNTDTFKSLNLIANDLASVPNEMSQDDLTNSITSTEIYNKLLTLLENDFMTPIETREDYIKQVMNTEVFNTLYNQLFKKQNKFNKER